MYIYRTNNVYLRTNRKSSFMMMFILSIAHIKDQYYKFICKCKTVVYDNHHLFTLFKIQNIEINKDLNEKYNANVVIVM